MIRKLSTIPCFACTVLLSVLLSVVLAAPAFASTVLVNDPYAQSVSQKDKANQWGLGVIGAFDAWSYARSEDKVAVAVLSSGVKFDHRDLRGRLNTEFAYDAVSETPMDQSYNDWTGIGTEITGVISATADNGIGLAGVSYDAQVVPINIFYYPGGTALSATTDIDVLCNAYDYLIGLVREKKINLRVIDLDVAKVQYSMGTADAILQQKINEAEQYGIVTVAPGGDGESYEPTATPVYPADYPTVVSVVPLKNDVELSDRASYGSGKNIAAPGADIITTGSESAVSYNWCNGSRFAAPFVAGTLAMMFAANPELTPVEAKQMMYDHAEDLGLEGWDAFYGSGRLNAAEAVKAAALSNADYVNIDEAEVSMEDSFIYTGLPIEPDPVVTYNGSKLQEGVDYAVTYSNNTQPGEASLTIVGIGNSANSQVIHFDIAKAAAPIIPPRETEIVYDGQTYEPDVSLPNDIQNPVMSYKLADGSFTPVVPQCTKVGSYVIEFRVESDNYQTAYGSIQITIDRRPISIRADDATLTYGEENPAFDYTIVEGSLVNEDDLGKISVTKPAESDSFKRVGDSAALELSYSENENYDITILPGTCTIVTALTGRFSDVATDQWCVTEGWLDYVVAKGLMSGYAGTDLFGPYDSLTRGQAATVLFRMETGLTAENTNNRVFPGFADTPAGQYYSAAVKWARECGIVTGYGNTGNFCAEQKVTREEMATMIARYAAWKGAIIPNTPLALATYPDSASVSPWAEKAMAWCSINGIVSGFPHADGKKYLEPGANLERAGLAKMITITKADVLK